MQPESSAPETAGRIDRISFILGMITAFAECVTNESKRLAFSPPFYAEDYTAIEKEAASIANDLSVHLWLETNDDLELQRPLHWLVIYKFPEVLEAYRQVRAEGMNPALHFEDFSELLSYGSVWGDGADRVSPRLREIRPQVSVFARILLDPADWPVASSAQGG
jgi:hypothetical protein